MKWFVRPKTDNRGIPYYSVCNDKDDRDFKFDCEQWAQECANSCNKLEESKKGGEQSPPF